MEIGEVFEDSGYPEITYVERRDGGKEQALTDYLFKQSAVVSLSGPSKSGKSALAKHVVQNSDRTPDELITIRGNNINSGEEFWKTVLEKIGQPSSRTVESRQGTRTSKTKGIGAALKAITAKYSKKDTEEDFEVVVEKQDLGLDEVIEIYRKEKFLIFLDDAHKISDDTHRSLAESIKEGLDRGLLMCVGYIDYRSDALTSADIDLSSRVDFIELKQWSEDDLQRIGQEGFDELNLVVPDEVIRAFASESIGSPQLMQKLCYTFCSENNIYYKQDNEETIDIGKEGVKEVLRSVANGLDKTYSTEYDLISGRAKGRTNTNYEFVDGTEGDRYRTVLRGIAVNNPDTSFSLSQLKQRIGEQCVGKSPQSGNTTQDVKRMSGWVDNSDKVESFIFDYIENKQKQVQVPEPSLILFLRWSGIIEYEPKLRVDFD
jgi:hypothetical protein